MPDQLTLEEILKSNPNLNKEEIERLIEEVRRQSVGARPQRGATQRRLVVGEEPSNAPRTVRLRSHR